MEIKTTYIVINGSVYSRVPPAMLEHQGLTIKEIKEGNVEGRIKDETGVKGNFCSTWAVKNGKKE